MAASTGVRVVAGLLGLLGLTEALFGVMSMNVGGTATRYGATRAGGSFLLIGLVLLAVGAAALVAAFGLWTFRPWGWTAAMALLGVGAAMSMLLALTGGSVGGLLVAVAWNLGPLWYLWTVQDRYRALSRQRHRSHGGARRQATGASPDDR